MNTVYLENGWKIVSCVDSDGQLNIYVENKTTDGETIYEVETEQGEGTEGEQYALRFTTSRMEKEYQDNN